MDDWVIWMICDSALPTGGFIASSGLESHIQLQFVTSTLDLKKFICNNIDSFASSSFHYLNRIYSIMDDNKEATVKNFDVTKILEQITELDFEYDSFLSNHVAVRASLAQGKNKNISINIF